MLDILQNLSNWTVAETLRQSSTAYPLVSAIHILALGVLVGAVLTLDLRMLGVFQTTALEQLATPLTRVAASGLALAMFSGFLLFSVRPDAYLENPAFLAKLGLVLLGTVHALAAHLSSHRREGIRRNVITPAMRISAVFSASIWIAAIVAGRWIGFL